jgi:arginine/lysine/ornithine decarboxylase
MGMTSTAVTGAPYLDALTRYVADAPIRLNVPGHKGRALAETLLGGELLAHDVPPLLHGIDAGGRPTARERAERLAACAWGAAETFFLTNGASQGNVACCLAAASLGATLIAPRNVHSSVIDGLVFSGLEPCFVSPAIDQELGIAHGMTVEALGQAIGQARDPAAVLVVSPTYFGAVADLARLVELAHAHDLPLIVDEAWGAHFAFHAELPASALSLGADAVISSTHKLAGSLTQSAMLHLGHGPHADRLRDPLQRALAATTSTSASSLLLASLDVARRLLQTQGHDLLEQSLRTATAIRRGVRERTSFALIDERLRSDPAVVGVDPLRIGIAVRDSAWSGFELGAELRRRHRIALEVLTDAVMVAVVGPGERYAEGGAALVEALVELGDIAGTRTGEAPAPVVAPIGEPRIGLREAFFSTVEVVERSEAAGRISAETLAAYPPGIPNLLPGELITAEMIDFLAGTVDSGGFVRGASDPALRRWRVIGSRR